MFQLSAFHPDGVTPDQLATAEDNFDDSFKYRVKVLRSGGMGLNTLNVGNAAGSVTSAGCSS